MDVKSSRLIGRGVMPNIDKRRNYIKLEREVFRQIHIVTLCLGTFDWFLDVFYYCFWNHLHLKCRAQPLQPMTQLKSLMRVGGAPVTSTSSSASARKAELLAMLHHLFHPFLLFESSRDSYYLQRDLIRATWADPASLVNAYE